MNLRKGLAIFLFLTLGVSTLILSRSVDSQTLYAFKHIKKIYLLYILMAVFTAWFFDALRFCMTAKAMGYTIPLRRGVMLTWLNYFGCALTPMQVGGGPFQVYMLYKYGVPVGAGVAITLVRTLFSTFLLSIAAPTAFILVPQLNEGGLLVKGVFFYVGTLSVVMWSLFLLSVFKASWVKNMAARLLTFTKKRMFRRLPVHRFYRLFCMEVDSYSDNVKRMVGPGRSCFIFAFLLSICHLTALLSVLPLLMHAVHLPVDYFHALLAQAMFMFILYFIPTPGASGVAEGGGAGIYSLLMPMNMAGVMAVVNRFFTEYLAIFMGCIVAIRLIGWGAAEKILSGDEEDENGEEDLTDGK
ncbi:MAG: lysylphosphatidylglycerol synthase transmembrane domain-containing protein [Pyramidobacter sp.]|jgi:uncharacterized protein (TIRG00374 family)